MNLPPFPPDCPYFDGHTFEPPETMQWECIREKSEKMLTHSIDLHGDDCLAEWRPLIAAVAEAGFRKAIRKLYADYRATPVEWPEYQASEWREAISQWREWSVGE